MSGPNDERRAELERIAHLNMWSASDYIAEILAYQDRIADLQDALTQRDREIGECEARAEQLTEECRVLRDEKRMLQETANGDGAEIERLRADLSFHPRAVKLMAKRKPFIVIACDEAYYSRAYSMIRLGESERGRWDGEDERLYQDAQSHYWNELTQTYEHIPAHEDGHEDAGDSTEAGRKA